MGIIFKKCLATELDILQKLSVDTFVAAFESQNDPKDFNAYIGKAFSLEQLQRELLNEDSIFYFVELKGQLIAYLKLNVNTAQSELKEPNGVELERIYVIKAYQGKGIGAEILAFAEDWGRNFKKTYLWLGVWEKNLQAIKFYERYGFVKFDTHPYYIGGDKQTDWLMKKTL